MAGDTSIVYDELTIKEPMIIPSNEKVDKMIIKYPVVLPRSGTFPTLTQKKYSNQMFNLASIT